MDDDFNDRFELLEQVGAGGMGVVHRARERSTAAVVAVKLLQRAQPDFVARFRRESELLSALSHPAVVGYVAHGGSIASPWLAMDWVDGVDLAARLRGGPLAPDAVSELGIVVADALAHVHAHGIVHRDLKPSNLMLRGGRSAEPVLLDLGVARPLIAETMTAAGAVVGTVGYMAPEQARGADDVGAAADLFSLGCVLFECASGSPAFSGGHLIGVLAKVLFEDPPRLRDLCPAVPRALELLVAELLAKDPRARPASAQDVVARLRESGVHLLAFPSVAPASMTRESWMSSVLVAREAAVDALGATAIVDATRSDALTPQSSPAAAWSRWLSLEQLGDGTTIAVARTLGNAADRAAELVRFARALVDFAPQIRVAIATGRSDRGRIPVGEAIDRAVALLPASAAGCVSVDDTTSRLVETRFHLSVAGRYFHVDSEVTEHDPTRLVLGRAAPCVGRGRELATLSALFSESVEDSRARVAIVTGPAGVGKSRLRRELLLRVAASERSPTIWIVGATPAASATPFALVARWLRIALGVGSADSLDQVRDRLTAFVSARVGAGQVEASVAALGSPLGILPTTGVRLDPERALDELRRAFAAVVDGEARQRPVLFVLEDLQWADPESVALYDALLARLCDAPLLVVALARPEVEEAFPLLWRDRDALGVRLGPLSRRAATELVEALAGDAIDRAAAALVVQRAEGNPFYLEELLRAAADGRLLSSPDTVIALAQDRLVRCPASERSLLRGVSVYRDAVNEADLLAVLDATWTSATLDDALGSLVRHELLVEPDSGSRERLWAFRHATLADASYATFDEADRRAAHLGAARRRSEAGSRDEEAAAHFADAGEPIEAARALARAAAVHRRAARMKSAAVDLLRATIVGSDAPASERAGWLEQLASVLATSVRVSTEDVLRGLPSRVSLGHGEARSLPTSLAEVVLASSPGPGDDAALAARLLLAQAGCVAHLGEREKARSVLDEARRSHPQELDRLPAAVARVTGAIGDFVETRRLLEEVHRRVVMPAQDHYNVLSGLVMALASSAGPGEAAEVDRLLCELDRVGTELPPDAQREHDRFRLEGLVMLFIGDTARSITANRRAIEIAHATGDRYQEAVGLHNLGDVLWRGGDADAAHDALVRSSELSVALDLPGLSAVNEAMLSFIDARRGAAGAAERALRAISLAERDSQRMREVHTRLWSGRALALTGDLVGARRQLECALRVGREAGLRTFADDAAATLAELDAAELG